MRIFVFPPFFFLVAYICVRKAGNLDHPHTLLSRETIVIKLDVSFQKKKKRWPSLLFLPLLAASSLPRLRMRVLPSAMQNFRLTPPRFVAYALALNSTM